MSWQRHSVYGEQPRKLLSGEAAESLCLRCDGLVTDKRTVEACRTAGGEDISDGVIGRVVGVAIVGPVVALNIKGLSRLTNGHKLLCYLRRLNRCHPLRLGSCRNRGEVAFENRNRLGGPHIADDGDDNIRRN